MSRPLLKPWRQRASEWFRRVINRLFPAWLPRPSWRHVVYETLWAIGITIVAQSVEHWPAVHSLEMMGLDAIEILVPRSVTNDVSIVQITDADFEDPKLFAGRRPLD